MDREKIIAIITGAISIAIAVAYLILVQFLDSRGEMVPAPTLEMLPLASSSPSCLLSFSTASPIDVNLE